MDVRVRNYTEEKHCTFLFGPLDFRNGVLYDHDGRIYPFNGFPPRPIRQRLHAPLALPQVEEIIETDESEEDGQIAPPEPQGPVVPVRLQTLWCTG
ncbi:uncharacterized protein E0L32_008271 [Thyridium curvatum]|uniref:Uncharacterized protein n=1 Tax=Thyridium curvatum TaxID=1093900 RepID=A0A507ALT3_9PEZI|nr:uncharacterized protein E0L32_008271 [Thyridium curvatum]TPX10702.1 hypothetical protein E0L32_008271 [Thyridium curvatum]